MRARVRIPLAAGAGVLAAVGFSGLGVQATFAWAWGGLIAAVIAVLGVALPDDPRADAPGRDIGDGFRGSEVSRLAWAINPRTGEVGAAVTRRVRATLRRRLALADLDPEAPADAEEVERRLGAGLWARLNGPRTSIQDIGDALAAAERLAPKEAP
ncbi:hypothetical protein [Microbacterium sp. NPDC058345]|uniref:hypothetical protein n=1 Tax=Microbacterium sp. NPDC058345 TaxID=3346455 RepID=UPI0036539C40